MKPEVERIARIIFEEFEASLRLATQGWKKAGRILKLILYGSHAQGDQVDDPVGDYRASYDILVVVNDKRLTDIIDYWSLAEDRLLREVTIARTISAPVNIIVHDLGDINRQLARGRPFFVDIVVRGIVLYEAEGFAFARPNQLPPDRERQEAQTYFDAWFSTAGEFFAAAGFHRARSSPRLVAFNLHQAAERLYHCVLLTLTLYSPKSHKLTFLRSHCEQIDRRLVAAWPRETRFERRCFELLRQAYIGARYSPDYQIGDDELGWLMGRVGALQAIVAEVCTEHLRHP